MGGRQLMSLVLVLLACPAVAQVEGSEWLHVALFWQGSEEHSLMSQGRGREE